MNKFGRRILAALITSSLVVTPVFAAPSVDDLQKSKASAQSEVNSLQSQLQSIVSKITQLEADLTTKGEEIIQAQADLEQAQEDAPEEITTLENPVRDKNAAKDAYKKDGIRIVCLDPALGGYAKGNESEMEDSKTESQYNLEFAQLIKSELNNQGVVVYMTREGRF